MAVETLALFSEDELTRFYYQKRQDEIYFQQLADRRAKCIEQEKRQAVERAGRAELAEQEKDVTIRSAISKAVKALINDNHSIEQIAKILSISKDAVMEYSNEQG